jgi:hypothetical protein
MLEKEIFLILLYGNFLQKMKKDKWNGILLDEFDFLDGI